MPPPVSLPAVSQSTLVNNPGGRDPNDNRTPSPPPAWNEVGRGRYHQNQYDTWNDVQRFSPSGDRRGRNSLAETIKAGKVAGGPYSICVLDTNTLVSAYVFLQSLFERLLHLTTQAYLDPCETPPPFVLVLPRFVLDELDHLKERAHVGRKARAAGHWLEDALRQQKRGRTVGNSNSEVKLPEERWPLHAQDWDSAKEMGGRLERGISMDEAIVQFCKRLQSDTAMPLMFCSNDTNARTRAEVEKISTFDLETVLKCIDDVKGGTHSRLREDVDGPSLLLEQWNVQLEGREASTRIEAMTHQITSGQDVEDLMELDDEDVLPASGSLIKASEDIALETNPALSFHPSAPAVLLDPQTPIFSVKSTAKDSNTSSSLGRKLSPRPRSTAIPLTSSTVAPTSQERATPAVRVTSEQTLLDNQASKRRRDDHSSIETSSATAAKRGTAASMHAPPSATTSSSRSAVRSNPYSRPTSRPAPAGVRAGAPGESRQPASSGALGGSSKREATSARSQAAFTSSGASAGASARSSGSNASRMGGVKRDRSTLASTWAPPPPSTSALLDEAKKITKGSSRPKEGRS